MRISDWSSDVCSSDLSQLFDRMLQVNAAAFYTDYKGIQIQIQRGIGASFENAGNARIKGFEVETIFAPSRVFRVSASAGYIDAYYRRINDPSGTITLRSEEHTSELQSLMRTSYAVF